MALYSFCNNSETNDRIQLQFLRFSCNLISLPIMTSQLYNIICFRNKIKTYHKLRHLSVLLRTIVYQQMQHLKVLIFFFQTILSILKLGKSFRRYNELNDYNFNSSPCYQDRYANEPEIKIMQNCQYKLSNHVTNEFSEKLRLYPLAHEFLFP